MKPIRSRSIVIALLVTSVSALSGHGLGRLLVRMAMAARASQGPTLRTPGKSLPNAAVSRPGGRPANARAAAAGLRIIYPNPRHRFPKPPGFSLNNEVRSTVVPIPLWSYSITASAAMGGETYTGTIIGKSPYDATKATTTIPSQIVPLVITITDTTTTPPTTVTYDPTAPDLCVPGHTGVELITGSPLFTNNPWTMNGVNVGTTQFIDAFQRAQFWSLVGGTDYHLILQPSVLGSQSLTFSGAGSSGPGQNYDAKTLAGGCGSVGVVANNDLDAAVQNLITGPLAAMVNAGTLPIFLTKNVVSAESGTNINVNCCILGYHNSFHAGPNLQIYSPFSIDMSGVFGNTDVSTLSHELGEAFNDPTGVNLTPSWGHLGQVTDCQTNLEVGDPLSPGFGTPTQEFVVVGANGWTYHLQELAFVNWFFDSPSLGAGGKSSSNGSFAGGAKPCPPGGTN
jgi:hypothetical protein